MHQLWSEKYRPKLLNDYVFKDEKQRQQLHQWIKQGALPNMLLTGSPGTGKTTLAKVLLNELNVDSFDIKEVNASKDNGVDFIRDSISKFAETMGVGSMRYILLDESDYISANGQAVLRGIMERYSSNVRFILTANYENKIIPAIKSRCETGRMHIDKLNKDEFTLRLCNILISESIEFDMDTVDTIVSTTYPDLRRGISMLQANSVDCKLVTPDADTGDTSDYKIDMIALFRAKKYREARTLICNQVRQEDYEDIYEFLYKNLEIWAEGKEEKEDMCVIAIRDGLVNHTLCVNSEINLSVTLIELEAIALMN